MTDGDQTPMAEQSLGSLPSAGSYLGPAPVVHPETRQHWAALGEGRLVLQQCRTCGTVRFPLAPVCWVCLSAAHDWVPIPTRGTVAAAVTVHRATGDQRWAKEVPFVAGQVDMAGGYRIPGRILCDAARPPVRGTPVQAAALSAKEGFGVLCFLLLEETS